MTQSFKMLAVAVVAFAGAAFAADGGSLKGSVKYDGEPPEAKAKEVPANFQGACQCNKIDDESLVVDKATKGIKWAIVRVLDVKGAPELTNPPKASFSQPKCKFEPHVFVVAPGSDVEVNNPDKVGHNVHTVPLDATNQSKNMMMVDEKMILKGKFFAEPEIIQIQCDIHPWMKCFAVVHDPRFVAITGTDGTFEIKDIPPGKYKVSIFQESLGEQVKEIEVKAGAASDLGETKFKQK